jgi:hypothetical protein
MGSLTALYINDYDTSRLGLGIERCDGRRDGLSVKDRVTQVPKRVGEVALAQEAEVTPRVLKVSGWIRGSSVTAARAALDELKSRCYGGTLEVRFADDPERLFYVRAEDCEIRGKDPDFATACVEVTLSLKAFDPLLYARQGTVLGFTTVRAPVPLGTAISLPTIRIHGAVTNPVITYRDARGVQQGQVGITVTLGATEALDIDCELMKLWRWTAGVRASGEVLPLTGDFMRLDPDDGDAANAVWPTLEVSPACMGEALYRKAWL